MVIKKIKLIIIVSILVLHSAEIVYGEIIAILPKEEYYIKIFRKFEEQLKNKDIEIARTTNDINQIDKKNNCIVISLGSSITKEILSHYQQIFFLMTADISIYNQIISFKKKKIIAGLFYIADINKRLQIIKEIFPSYYSIGIIYSKKSKYYAELIKKLAENNGIKTYLYLSDKRNFSEVLENAITDNDIFWMIPDFYLYNYSNIKTTLVIAVKKAKPVITFSPIFLEGGAFLSYKINDDAYIKQAVNIFYNCYIENNCQIEFAKDFQIIINKNLAKFWRITIPKNKFNIILK